MLFPYTTYEKEAYRALRRFNSSKKFMTLSVEKCKMLIKAQKFLNKRYDQHRLDMVEKKLKFGENVTNKPVDPKNSPPSGYKDENGYDDFAYAGYVETPPNLIYEGPVIVSPEQWRRMKNFD